MPERTWRWMIYISLICIGSTWCQQASLQQTPGSCLAASSMVPGKLISSNRFLGQLPTQYQPAGTQATGDITQATLSSYRSMTSENAPTNVRTVSNQVETTSTRLDHEKSRIDNLHRSYSQVQQENEALKERLQTLESSINQLNTKVDTKVPTAKLDKYRGVIKDLSRQVAMQQLFLEERIRSDGNSGIKRVRSIQHGTKAYYSQTVVAGGPGSIHDHSNYDRTVGLDELDVVMNGVEFKTRHNDYRVVQPSSFRSNYHATQLIDLPPVPPEVLNKTTVTEQIKEMRMFFKAFHMQKKSIRDYRPYFPAVLCYMEGAWTQTKPNASLEEPFMSVRHKIDAKSWYDLQEKIWFTANNGRKDDSENYAFLPTTITEFTDDGPRYAQWNYRILCHKLKDDLPTRSMRLVDDLATRMRYKWTLHDLVSRRQARFQMGPFPYWDQKDRVISPGALLDRLMYEIPGKNNYGAALNDTSRYFTMREPASSKYLNAAYYNRYFDSGKGAMGSSRRRRGFSDDFLFTALTTHEEVAPRGVQRCYGKQGCKMDYQRVTYAIPLEIIYLNPLQSWNPFNLSVHLESYKPREDNRNGGYTAKSAFNGISRIYNYKTPKNFYNGAPLGTGSTPADTVRGSVGVLTPEGNVKVTTSSGIKVLLDTIAGVGKIRQRYPIFPVHQEGSHEWIQMEALKEMVYNPKRFEGLIDRSVKSATEKSVNMYTDIGSDPFPHDHTLTLEPEQIELLNQGKNVTVVTDEKGAHTHSIEIYIESTIQGNVKYGIIACDGKPTRCWDGHSRIKQEE